MQCKRRCTISADLLKATVGTSNVETRRRHSELLRLDSPVEYDVPKPGFEVTQPSDYSILTSGSVCDEYFTVHRPIAEINGVEIRSCRDTQALLISTSPNDLLLAGGLLLG